MSLENRTAPTEDDYVHIAPRQQPGPLGGRRRALGALNHITPARAAEAGGAGARRGRTVSLGRPLQARPGPANPWPASRLVGMPQAERRRRLHGDVPPQLRRNAHRLRSPTSPGPDGRNLERQNWIGENHMPIEHSGTVDYWSDGIVTRGCSTTCRAFRNVEFVACRPTRARMGVGGRREVPGVRVPRAGDAVIIRLGTGPRTGPRRGTPQQFASVAGACTHPHWSSSTTQMTRRSLIWDFQDAPEARHQGLAQAPHRAARSRSPCTCTPSPFPTWGCLWWTTPTSADSRPPAPNVDRWEFQLTVALAHHSQRDRITGSIRSALPLRPEAGTMLNIDTPGRLQLRPLLRTGAARPDGAVPRAP